MMNEFIFICFAVLITGMVINNKKLGRIMANQEELAASLEEANTRLQKAMQEIIAAIAASGTTTPRVDAAVAALQAAAQAFDDLNPDAPTP